MRSKALGRLAACVCSSTTSVLLFSQVEGFCVIHQPVLKRASQGMCDHPYSLVSDSRRIFKATTYLENDIHQVFERIREVLIPYERAGI